MAPTARNVLSRIDHSLERTSARLSKRISNARGTIHIQKLEVSAGGGSAFGGKSHRDTELIVVSGKPRGIVFNEHEKPLCGGSGVERDFRREGREFLGHPFPVCGRDASTKH